MEKDSGFLEVTAIREYTPEGEPVHKGRVNEETGEEAEMYASGKRLMLIDIVFIQEIKKSDEDFTRIEMKSGVTFHVEERYEKLKEVIA